MTERYVFFEGKMGGKRVSIAADPIKSYMTRQQFDMHMTSTEKKMKDAAKDLDFITAAQFRNELFALKKKYKDKFAYLNN